MKIKTFGKIVICIIVVVVAIGIAYLIFKSGGENATSTNVSSNTQSKVENQLDSNNKVYELDEENKDYIGKEEIEEPEEEKQEQEQEPEQSHGGKADESKEELAGKDKAIDIVKKQYAMEGQTVRFDHMEEANYIIKVNDGTAVTWYLVNGTTWEAEEY